MDEKNKMNRSGKKMDPDPKLIIFTDLDGTLLDAGYSFNKALTALALIREQNIPLIICSSKTRVEIEHCRKKLKNTWPFISENGGGIYIPDNSTLKMKKSKFRTENRDSYMNIKLGAEYRQLRNALQELRSEGFAVKGFGDMSVKEVADLTGLKTADAKRAKQREFDEPFVFQGNKTALRKLRRSIEAKGFNYTRGEFHHIMGDSDKGRAVGILKELYKKQYGAIITAGMGDSVNDIEMLCRVDYPVVVQKNDGTYNAQVLKHVKGHMRAGGIGPEGWNKSVIKLITDSMH